MSCRAARGSMLEERLDPVEHTDEALGSEHHHEQEHQPVDDLVVVAELVTEETHVRVLDPVRHPEIEGGAQDRAPQRLDATDDQHHEDAETKLHAEVAR